MSNESLLITTVRCPVCGAEATLSYRARARRSVDDTVYLCPNFCPAPDHVQGLIDPRIANSVPP